jgi:hypothetical protein
MMDTDSKKESTESIKEQIDQALKQIEMIKNQTSTIRNATDLEDFEKQIGEITDRLAGLLTAKMIQQSLDSDEVRQQSSQLIKSMPHKMESQGLRDVQIMPLKGGAVTVKAAYYTKKSNKKSKKKKR